MDIGGEENRRQMRRESFQRWTNLVTLIICIILICMLGGAAFSAFWTQINRMLHPPPAVKPVEVVVSFSRTNCWCSSSYGDDMFLPSVMREEFTRWLMETNEWRAAQQRVETVRGLGDAINDTSGEQLKEARHEGVR